MKTKRLFHSKVFFFTLIAFSIIFGGRRSFGYEWSKTFGGNEDDRGHSVQQTTDGGFIISGKTGDIPGYMEEFFDVYLIKTDGSGNQQWSKTFGGSESNRGNSVQQTADGGFIIAGWTGFVSASGSSSDVYLIKTDGSGNQQWSKTFGGSMWENGNSVQQTADGGFIIAGNTWSFGAGSSDVYLIKTDGSGNEQWSKTFGGSEKDHGSSVQQTADGGFIIAGTTESYGAGFEDVYLIKTDSSGNQQWSKTFGGSMWDYGNSVQQTADGGFIIAGATHSFGAGSEDVYLIKTDGSGNQQWSKTFGGSEWDHGSSVQQTADGGFIIAGATHSFGAGSEDVYLIKTDGSGNQQWSKTFGGSVDDNGKSVQQTDDGGFIIAGWTASFGAGSWDVYLIYYKPDYEKLSYTPVSPCRIVDTRMAGGSISAGGIRSYNVRGAVASQGGNSAACLSPQGEPHAVHLNVTAVPVAGPGHLRLFPFNTPTPVASMLNYSTGAGNRPNAITVETCYGCTKDVNVQSFCGTTHVVIDVMGYYYLALAP